MKRSVSMLVKGMFLWVVLIGGVMGLAREGWAVTVIKSTRLAYSDGDDGNALPNLLSRIDSLPGYDVIDGGYKTITEIGSEIYSNTLLFITGHSSFSFTDEERTLLGNYLQNGGLIWGDDCT